MTLRNKFLVGIGCIALAIQLVPVDRETPHVHECNVHGGRNTKLSYLMRREGLIRLRETHVVARGLP